MPLPPDAVPDDPAKIFSNNQAYQRNLNLNNGGFYRNSISPTSLDLDPYFFFLKYDAQYGGFVPFNDYSIVVKDYENNTADFNIQKDPIKGEVRIVTTKTPMIISGWGYDVCGVATPAYHEGQEDRQRYFHPRTPIDRGIWKSGPLDLRWDNQRKVWVGGAEIIEGLMVEGLPSGDPDTPSTGVGQIYRSTDMDIGSKWRYDKYTQAANPDPIYAIRPDPWGGIPLAADADNIGEWPELVKIHNRNPSLSLSAGDYFAATKINYEWRVISGGGGGSCIVGKFKRVNCAAKSTDKSVLPAPTVIFNNGKRYLSFGVLDKKYIYYKFLDFFLDIIPSEGVGGTIVDANGFLEIPPAVGGTYFISLVAFENCKYSSDVITLEIFPNGTYGIYFIRVLQRLFDCPDSQDCFGTVTDDVTGSIKYAIHPFKFIKHDVRVIACASNQVITCGENKFPAMLITEIDECANAGTGEVRE
jgi:hypothetical protein